MRCRPSFSLLPNHPRGYLPAPIFLPTLSTPARSRVVRCHARLNHDRLQSATNRTNLHECHLDRSRFVMIREIRGRSYLTETRRSALGAGPLSGSFRIIRVDIFLPPFFCQTLSTLARSRVIRCHARLNHDRLQLATNLTNLHECHLERSRFVVIREIRGRSYLTETPRSV